MNYIQQHWTEQLYTTFITSLKEQSDLKYKEFNTTIAKNKEEAIGIRIPILRTIAKEIAKGNFREFLQLNQFHYYEEFLVYGFVIGYCRIEYEEFIKLTDKFITKISNWAVCDTFCTSIKIVKKNKASFWEHINTYLCSSNPWIVRVGIVSMLCYYLEEEYIDDVLKRCNTIQSDFYYVNMAQAWLISTAFIKHRNKTLDYLKYCQLNQWTFNKSIQKARESYRVTPEDKELLNAMKKK